MSEPSLEWMNGAAGQNFPPPEIGFDAYHGPDPTLDHTQTETWFFGFSVPDQALNAFIYVWAHPNLGVVTAGVAIYKGLKSNQLAAELFDYQAYLPISCLEQPVLAFPNGLRIEIEEPLRLARVSYQGAGNDTEFDVSFTGVALPAVRGNLKHFEQLMRFEGRLRLRGENHDLKGWHVRDRSWGEGRPEGDLPLPPYGWITGFFGDDFAFNISAHDHHSPADGKIDDAPGFRDGWLLRDGRMVRFRHVRKSTERDPETLTPRRLLIEATDVEGGRHRFVGEIVAGLPWHTWPNMVSMMCLARWSADDGRWGWGDVQDVCWNTTVWKATGRPA